MQGGALDAAARRQLNEDLRRLADGDRAASRPLFEQLWPVLRRFAARAVDESAAEDVAQRALVTLFGRASDFDPSRDALGWAIELTAWEIRTERKRRSRARTEPLPDRGGERASEDDPEGATSGAETTRAVRAALEELDEVDRATIEAVLDETRPEGVAQATFRKRKERAMGRLRTMWRLLHGDG